MRKNRGFSAVELIIAMVIAVLFITTGYQLYNFIVRASGEARQFNDISNLLQSYIDEYKTSATNPCTSKSLLSNHTTTVEGVGDVQINASIDCQGSTGVNTKISCPENFILVPGSDTYGTNSFCVSKYEIKIKSNSNGAQTYATSMVPESRANGTPWVNISQAQALAEASSYPDCSSCHLITAAEWMTIAQNVLNVPSNWKNNAVGSNVGVGNFIYQGHVNNNPPNSIAASTSTTTTANEDSNGLYGITGGIGTTVGFNTKRTLILNNGEVIWDFAGNVGEWIADTISGGTQPGLSGESAYSSKEWNNSSLIIRGLPSFMRPTSTGIPDITWNSSSGIGVLYSNYGEALSKSINIGGYWGGGWESGIFNISTNLSTADTNIAVGFRIAAQASTVSKINVSITYGSPSSTVSSSIYYEPPCQTGYVLVPGSKTYGTTDFCVMKYEAKQSGGVAVSTADGTPWGGMNYDMAVTNARTACANCHLITEAEWMTIAQNILKVPANWSNDGDTVHQVGTGTLYVGHSDGSPASAQAANTDDTLGYQGTGQTSGNQKRTLVLSNGEVIWDMSGNLTEWTTGTINKQKQPGYSGDSAYSWREWNNPSLLMNGLPYLSQPQSTGVFGVAWSSSAGVGMIYSNYTDKSKRGFLRGGSYNTTAARAGILMLGLDPELTSSSPTRGFRATYTLPVTSPN